MTSKSPVRSCEDVDETALSYAEIKALCAGDDRIKEKMDLDIVVARLRLLKADHKSQRYKLEDDLIKHYPEQIAAVTARITGIEKDISMYNDYMSKTVVTQEISDAAPKDGEAVKGSKTSSVSTHFPPMTILGVTYTEREPAAKALLEARSEAMGKGVARVGEYCGFSLSIRYDVFSSSYELTVKGATSHSIQLGADAFGNLTRLNNAFNDMPKRLESAQAQLENIHKQVKDAEAELKAPFTQEAELAEKESRLAYLNAELNIDGSSGELELEADAANDTENAVPLELVDLPLAATAKARPSILDEARAYSAAVNWKPAQGGRDKSPGMSL